MKAKQNKPRSPCPIAATLDLLGDRWTLLVLRDVLLAQRRTFSEFAVQEGIATNTLSDRLKRLEEARVLKQQRDPNDGRRRIYIPTERGVALIPLLLELHLWGTEHTTGTGYAVLAERARTNREALIAELTAQARGS